MFPASRFCAISLTAGLAVVSACSSRPVPFSRGQAIPIGSYTITVSHTEASARENTLTLVVHFRCQGVEDTGKFFVAQSGHLFVIDGAGNRYSARPLPRGYYQGQRRGPLGLGRGDATSSHPAEWVAVANVPVNSRGFSLLIGNPARKPGQPRTAVVQLDR